MTIYVRARTEAGTVTTLVTSAQDMLGSGTLAGLYMAELAAEGPSPLISNVRSSPMLMRCGDLQLPVTVESGVYGESYVVSPHSHYVLYARDEIDIIGLRAGRTAAKGILAAVRPARNPH